MSRRSSCTGRCLCLYTFSYLQSLKAKNWLIEHSWHIFFSYKLFQRMKFKLQRTIILLSLFKNYKGCQYRNGRWQDGIWSKCMKRKMLREKALKECVSLVTHTIFHSKWKKCSGSYTAWVPLTESQLASVPSGSPAPAQSIGAHTLHPAGSCIAVKLQPLLWWCRRSWPFKRINKLSFLICTIRGNAVKACILK